MNLIKQIQTENDCYKAKWAFQRKGIMVHSTGANNPRLGRYVVVPGVTSNKYQNDWNRPGIGAAVHAFIGLTDAGDVATVQCLPFDIASWHAGTGRAPANTTHISFEICEDGLTDKTYFDKVYKEAAEFCAYLCEMFGFNPATDIICHYEGHKAGIASNHGDVMHWFPKHGKSMDTFRNDVYNLVHAAPKPAPDIVPTPHAWAAESWNKACAFGVFDGSSPDGPMTREMCAVVLDRLGLLKDVKK